MRDGIKPHIWSRIGDGASTLVWFDQWHSVCPLSNIVSNRDIRNAGFTRNMQISDLMENGNWKWPRAWLDLFHVLLNLPNIQLNESMPDSIFWKDIKGNECDFSSSIVWDTLRSRSQEVNWHKAVWFKQMIPRYAFLMWLIFLQKLKTQDKIMKWSAGGNMNYNLVCCPLCYQGPDSHNHLFFACSYSSQIWQQVNHLAHLQHLSSNWDDITLWLIMRGNSNSAKTVIGKLLVVATAYFIWQERNQRLFANLSRPVDQLRDLISSTVRLKLVTLRFKNTTLVNRFVQDWNLPRDLVVFDQHGS